MMMMIIKRIKRIIKKIIQKIIFNFFPLLHALPTFPLCKQMGTICVYDGDIGPVADVHLLAC